MASTNKTEHYNLPQFTQTDKPAWINDINPAMSAIDGGIWAAKEAANGAKTSADAATITANEAKAIAEQGGKGTLSYAQVGEYGGGNCKLAVRSQDATVPYIVFNDLMIQVNGVRYYTAGALSADANITVPTTTIIKSGMKAYLVAVGAAPPTNFLGLKNYDPDDPESYYVFQAGDAQYMIVWYNYTTRIYRIGALGDSITINPSEPAIIDNAVIIRR